MPDYYYQRARWEGQPLSFKIKFIFAKYPAFAAVTILSIVMSSVVAAVRIPGYENTQAYALNKYKSYYIVARDDDPRIDYIIEQKERGRHLFPEH